MKSIVVFIVIALMLGCATTKSYTNAQEKRLATASVRGDGDELLYNAQLLEIAYKDVSEALVEFAKLGVDASYFSPKLRGVFNYPELYIVSTKKSNQATVVFLGTDSFGDWFQNIKTNNYSDVPKNGEFFVPSGHGGFRLGVHNLLKKDFFSEVLPAHLKQFDVRNTQGSVVDITLAGHSQGAGIAQLVAPIFDGYKYKSDKIVKADSWPYKVRAIYGFAPPLAIAIEGESWDFMSEHYGKNTWQIIRDTDMVSSLYNAGTNGTQVSNRHFGQLVRINRDDEVVYEKTEWGSKVSGPYKDKPHLMSGYRTSIEKAQKQNAAP